MIYEEEARLSYKLVFQKEKKKRKEAKLS